MEKTLSHFGKVRAEVTGFRVTNHMLLNCKKAVSWNWDDKKIFRVGPLCLNELDTGFTQWHLEEVKFQLEGPWMPSGLIYCAKGALIPSRLSKVYRFSSRLSIEIGVY